VADLGVVDHHRVVADPVDRELLAAELAETVGLRGEASDENASTLTHLSSVWLEVC
jgi:hypothetical protein